jgi:hypothetical protein
LVVFYNKNSCNLQNINLEALQTAAQQLHYKFVAVD